MEADRIRWNEKFVSRENVLRPPESFILKNEHLLKQGSILDIACGDGRNALYLASQGFQVTGVDIADVGLERLHQFAQLRNERINTHQIDLEERDSLNGLGVFDNVILMYYKPSVKLWNQIVTHVKQEGTVLFCTFNIRHHEVHGFPRKFSLAPRELIGIHPQLEVVSYESVEELEKFLDQYVFKKSL